MRDETMPGPMGDAARRMFGGQGDDELFGGQGNDALGWLRKPKLGVDYGTGKPYDLADQGDAATAYPGQGGSGYPTGSEAARMQKPPMPGSLYGGMGGMSRSMPGMQDFADPGSTPPPPMGRSTAPDIDEPVSGLQGGVYIASDGRRYDLTKDPALRPHAANGYKSIIDMIEKKAPLAERWRSK